MKSYKDCIFLNSILSLGNTMYYALFSGKEGLPQKLGEILENLFLISSIISIVMIFFFILAFSVFLNSDNINNHSANHIFKLLVCFMLGTIFFTAYILFLSMYIDFGLITSIILVSFMIIIISALMVSLTRHLIKKNDL